jgi:hypothetical protein
MRGNTRSFGARVSPRLLTSVLAAVITAAVATPLASAAVPAFADNCGGVNNFDYAVCERMDYVAQQQDSIAQSSTLIWYGIWTLAGLVIVLMIAPLFVDAFRFWR